MVSAGHYLRFNLANRNYSMSEIKKFCSNFLHFCFKFVACFLHENITNYE